MRSDGRSGLTRNLDTNIRALLFTLRWKPHGEFEGSRFRNRVTAQRRG